MARKKELKEKATEVLTAAVQAADDLAEKAAPLAEKAAEKAADATKGMLADAKEVLADLETHGEEALTAVEQHAKAKKSHKARNITCATLALVGVGGAAYLMWRRSRPVEDPWAEEYWVDLKEEVPSDEETVAAEVAAEIAAEDEAIVEAIEEVIAEAEAAEK